METTNIGEFKKVSFEQFKKDWLKASPTNKTDWTDEELKAVYDAIPIPQRGTGSKNRPGMGAAGYDIIAPCDINLAFGKSVVIPTGLSCQINDGWDLDIYPRSGHGFKYGIRLANTVGIIDNDYCGSPDNEGHILVKIVNNESAVNENKDNFRVAAGKGFCQAIFRIFGTTRNDEPQGSRNGGFGSTDRK